MQLTGKHIIAGEFSKEGSESFYATNPSNSESLAVEFCEATLKEIDEAVQEAEVAFQHYRKVSGKDKAHFLDTIGEEIMALGDDLLNRCHQETGLPLQRLMGERGRTVNQLKMFADLLREGSWINATIDTAMPEREPIPKPDIRQMQIGLGAVGIFGASNFPLAFSVAGGDTASALAAGCSVVVKGHPAHPGTSEMVGRAIASAAKATHMPRGVFSLLQGQTPFVGMAIANHSLIKAIGFTGSYRGGKALYDAAAKREHPIPVYAEMGSINPVFILPEALKKRQKALVEGLATSVTLGVGQFCTNPGLLVSLQSEESQTLSKALAARLESIAVGTMLTEKIALGYQQQVDKFKSIEGVALVNSENSDDAKSTIANLLQADGQTFLDKSDLSEEVFGPSTLHIVASNRDELLKIAVNLEGHLTATLQAEENDLKDYADLVEILERKVGRLIVNGYPTGVEVCHAMVHGGPFPATTDSRTTSVGTGAIYRFSRPVCYQNFPEFLLPDELKDNNPLNIWQTVNGQKKQ